MRCLMSKAAAATKKSKCARPGRWNRRRKYDNIESAQSGFVMALTGEPEKADCWRVACTTNRIRLIAA
jgi:hypothetical protein